MSRLNARQNLRSELGQITTFGDILTDSNTPRVSECIRARNPSVRVGANVCTPQDRYTPRLTLFLLDDNWKFYAKAYRYAKLV